MSKKRAIELVKREFGIYKCLERDNGTLPEVSIYRMKLGSYLITVDNDWFGLRGLIRLHISAGTGEDITRFFKPDMLEEDLIAEDEEQRIQRKEDFEERVEMIGLEGCRKILERK